MLRTVVRVVNEQIHIVERGNMFQGVAYQTVNPSVVLWADQKPRCRFNVYGEELSTISVPLESA